MGRVRWLIYLLVTACAGGMALAPAARAADWPRFRGPDGLGHCEETGLPVHWGPGDVAWRAELEGRGFSSPCIADGRIFLTTARRTDDGQIERIVFCLDRTDGHLLWRQVAWTGEPEKIHRMNSYATPTCATDGRHVVAFFGPGGIHAYDVDGKPLWSRDLGSFPGPWGTGASPILVGRLVIQNCDAAGPSSLIALDVDTGKTAWKTDRGERPRGGWNTPFVIDADGRRELILNGESGVRGYDPADGHEFWFCESFNGRGTPIPAYGHGLLYVISGLAGDAYAVRPGGEGDVTDTRMAWHTRRRGGRDLSSPILVGDYLFVVNMAGIATCYRAGDGKQLWQERLDGNFSASPIVAAGLVYIQNEAGQTLVIKPGDTLEVVARNDLGAPEGELFRSTLAPSDGQLFFRSDGVVYCVGKRNLK